MDEASLGAVYNTRGYCYFKTKRNEQALSDYARAIEYHYKAAHENLAALYNHQGEYDLALDAASAAIEAFPERLHGYRERATASLERWLAYPEPLRPNHADLLTQAIADASQAIALSGGKDHKAFTIRGQTKLSKGEWKDAEADFKEALAIMPNFIKAQAGLYKAQKAHSNP